MFQDAVKIKELIQNAQIKDTREPNFACQHLIQNVSEIANVFAKW